MRLADAGWAEQEQRITVSHPPAGCQIADLLRVERRLGVELEAVEDADERELGDAQAHADPPFLAVRHLGGAHQGERLAEGEIAPPGLVEQVVEPVARRLQAEPRQHLGQAVELGIHHPPPAICSYSASGRNSSPTSDAMGVTGEPRSLAMTPTRWAGSRTRSRRPRRSS